MSKIKATSCPLTKDEIVKHKAEVEAAMISFNGDPLATSSNFPDGIFIGLVSNYSFIAGKGYYNIDVELNNSIGNEVNVYIINNLNQLEIKNLE